MKYLFILLVVFAIAGSAQAGPGKQIFSEDEYMPCPVIIEKIEALKKYKAEKAKALDDTTMRVLFFIATRSIIGGKLSDEPEEVNIDAALAELQERLKTCEPY